MITKSGTHGTCKSYADEIETLGFYPSSGRGGTGVYFWRRESIFSKELAEAWYLFRKSTGKFKNVNDDRGAVIYASFTVGDNEYMNLEKPEVKDDFALFLKALGKLGDITDKEICDAWDFYITEIENDAEEKIKLLEIRVGIPQHGEKFFKFYNLKSLGAPISYILREPTDIQIENIEVIENE